MTPPLTEQSPLIERLSQIRHDTEELCLFRLLPKSPEQSAVIGISGADHGSTFSKPAHLFSEFLSAESKRFFKALRFLGASHYSLLLSEDRKPILVCSSLREYGSLFLAIVLPSSPEAALSFLNTMPSITVQIDPCFSKRSSEDCCSPETFARLNLTFQRLFAFFESPYAAPSEYHDPLRLYRLMRMKFAKIAEAFGINAEFLIQHVINPLPSEKPTVDLSLYSATALLLLFAVKTYSIESNVRIVFISLDYYPALCLHFRIGSEEYERSELLQFLKKLYAYYGCYFTTCFGAHARTEAQKIPGIGHMINNDRYSSLGDHVLNVFAPVKRDWTNFVLHSPIFRLPAGFFDNFTV